MRRQYQVVVAVPDGCENLIHERWRERAQAGGVQLACWPLPALPGPEPGSLQWPEASASALAMKVSYWTHFDVCLLPVTAATLAWSRVALANVPARSGPPLLLLAAGLSPAAVADLLRLGAADFVLDTDNVDELCVRLQALVARARHDRYLQAPAITGGAAACADGAAAYETEDTTAVSSPTPWRSAHHTPQTTSDWIEMGLRRSLMPGDANEDYRHQRNEFLKQFEREYVCTMLRLHAGNVSGASRAGGVARRTFWRLMRKFDIESATFRREAQERMAQRWRPVPLKSRGHPS